MEPATATDVCDGFFKSINITVRGNATIIEQKGRKLVYSVEQRKTLDNCGRKVPYCATGCTVRWLVIKA